jgi:hypothetical protein
MRHRQEPATGRRGVDAQLPPAHPPHGARMYAVPLPTGQGVSMKFPPETCATGSPVCNGLQRCAPCVTCRRVGHIPEWRTCPPPCRLAAGAAVGQALLR